MNEIKLLPTPVSRLTPFTTRVFSLVPFSSTGIVSVIPGVN